MYELFIYFIGVLNGSVVLFNKGKLFPKVLMTTIYIKEKRVSCKTMGNITKIHTLCKSENVVNTPSELTFFVFRRLFKNTTTLLEKKLKDS